MTRRRVTALLAVLGLVAALITATAAPASALHGCTDDDPATSEPVTIELPPTTTPTPTPTDDKCDAAKAKLAKAKEKLRRLKEHDAPQRAIDKAKAKVKKQRGAVQAACA